MQTSCAPAGLTDQIREIVSAIFENMLGIPAELDDCMPDTSMEFSSCVRFTGSWSGLVILECMRQSAHNFAESFLSMPRAGIGDRIACDVLGELANMIAGNLKPLFASDIQLSSVELLCGPYPAPINFAPTVCEKLFFRCAADTLLVTVLAAPMPVPQSRGDN